MRQRGRPGLLRDQAGSGQKEEAPPTAEPETTAPQTVYWTLDVQDAQVILRDGTAPKTVDLVLRRDGEETVARTLKLGSGYGAAEDIRAWTFQDVLGSGGFVLWTGWSGWRIRRYFTIEGNTLVQIAESFGGEDYSVDLDGDGVKELVSNVVYGGDGHASVFVYQRREDGIWRGRLNWGDLPGHDNWGVNSTWEEYDPVENVFRIHYTVKDREEPGVLESSGLTNITFKPFEAAP